MIRTILLVAAALTAGPVWAAAPAAPAPANEARIQLDVVLYNVPRGSASTLQRLTEGPSSVVVDDKVGEPAIYAYCVPPEARVKLSYFVEARKEAGARKLASPRLV